MRLIGNGLLGICLVLCLAHSARSEQAWLVDFRLRQWKSMHFDSEKQADVHYRTVKQLGCEVRKFAHNGHTDVKYRCPRWKQMKLETDKEAHQWVRWLKKVGFETRHEH
jgi:hypothetical protein